MFEEKNTEEKIEKKIKISECEEEVLMEVYLMQEAPDLMTVYEKVNEDFSHEWAPQTVSTFLSRLVRKGYLTTDKKGRYTYYYCTISLDDYRRKKIVEMKDRLFGGSPEKMMEFLQNIF